MGYAPQNHHCLKGWGAGANPYPPARQPQKQPQKGPAHEGPEGPIRARPIRARPTRAQGGHKCEIWNPSNLAGLFGKGLDQP